MDTAKRPLFCSMVELLFKKHGGYYHGPRANYVGMSEHNMWNFLNDFWHFATKPLEIKGVDPNDAAACRALAAHFEKRDMTPNETLIAAALRHFAESIDRAHED